MLDRERSNVDSKLGGKRQRLVRRAVSRARFTDDRWDNPADVCDRLDTRLDDDALGSFRGSQCVAEGHAARSTVGSIVGDVLGGVALLLVVVVLIGCPLLSPEARDETGLIDGERVPLAAALYVSRCCARRRRAAIRSCRWLHSRR